MYVKSQTLPIFLGNSKECGPKFPPDPHSGSKKGWYLPFFSRGGSGGKSIPKASQMKCLTL